MRAAVSCGLGVASVLLFGAVAANAVAQTSLAGPSERINGTIEWFDGQILSVHALDGRDLSIAVPEGVRNSAVADRQLADIKPGDFVGSAAVKGRDGKLHAQEVHIFPEAMRGTGEGHRPMAGAEQTMTNAVVDGMAGVTQGDSHGGQVLTLKYASGEQAIEVSPTTRVVLLVPGDKMLLKRGGDGFGHEGRGRHADGAVRSGREGWGEAAALERYGC